jgi:hypothetical protein
VLLTHRKSIHFPSWQMSPWRQTLPHVPQLLLSNRVPVHGGVGGGLGWALFLLRRLRLLLLLASVSGTPRTVRPEASAPATTRTVRREPPRATSSLSASSQ